MKTTLFILALFAGIAAQAQSSQHHEPDGVKFYLDRDSNTYLKMTGAIQVWLRYTQNNPGSGFQFNGNPTFYPEAETFDIGIRRARFQVFGPIHKRVFFYSQFGINNFSYLSARKLGAFFHDLTGEINVKERALSIGSGLTGWSGLSRYASPSIVSTLMYDAPLYQQATNDITDQFLRKLSVYAKGKVSKLDYRMALSKPMPVQLASIPTDTAFNASYTNISVFSPKPAELQKQAYFNWQFLDEESNLIPYTVGSYLGTKRVFNLGAGIIQQNKAMRHQNAQLETVYSDLLLWSADLFLDYALDREKHTAITIYACYANNDFGPNYIRALGVMNSVNASNNALVSKFSGYGNAFPMFGSGNSVYLQGAYLFKKDLLKSFGTLQVYADALLANYQALQSPMLVWNGGLNWFIKGHNAKVSLNYQNRPVFSGNTQSYGATELSGERKGMLVTQLQVAF